VGQATRDKLDEARDLLRHAVPDGDLDTILGEALELLIEKTKRRRFGAPAKGRRRRTTDSVRNESGSGAVAAPPAAPVGSAEASRGAVGERSLPTESASPKREATGSRSSRAEAAAANGEASEPRSSRAESAVANGVEPRRYIPARVRRAVFERDGGRCTFVSPGGRRCTERGALELNHRVPHARGGGAEVEDLELCCSEHNLLLAEVDFGREHVRAAIATRRGG
jgi:5-methylcytosine-specific restriction endonuclease McrA